MGEPVFELPAGYQDISSLAFSSDGKHLACGGMDGVRLWNATSHAREKQDR
jgi:hypothetical protein